MAKKESKTGFVKNYIGKGVQVKDLDIVKVTLDITQALEHAYECEGKKYLTFEVAKMQQADDYGKTRDCKLNSV
jgi:hypothetical protein